MHRKNFILLGAALLVSFGLPAYAELKYENSSGGSVTLYGQFNPGYLSFDDGVETYNNLVDNGHSNSRVGLILTQPYSFGEFGFNFETGLGFPTSFAFSQTFEPEFQWNRTSLRKIDFSLKTDAYGTFYVGQGSMATDGVASVDLSGTTLVNYNSIGDTAGNSEFRTSAGASSGIKIGNVMPSLDGGRRGRVRYDFPSFADFTFKIAYGEEILVSGSEDKFYDGALVYANEFANGTELKGGIGWSRRERPGAADRDDRFGSVSVLLPSGFNLTVALGNRKDSGRYSYSKIGYIVNWLSVGSTALAVDYYDGRDFNVAGSSSGSFGLGVVQSFKAANTEAYLEYRDYEYADTADAYLDASSFLFGARWKF